MNIEKILSRDKLAIVAGIKDSGAGKILMELVEIERDRFRKQYETKPEVNDHDIKRDFKFLFGCVYALNLVLNIPVEAGKLAITER